LTTKIYLTCLGLLVGAVNVCAQLAGPIPENLGLGLRQLVETSQGNQAQAQAIVAPSVNADDAGRVLVNVQLNGTISLSEVEAKLVELGLEITASDSHWRNGVISAWLPVSQAVVAANLGGVRSITLARKPIRRVGAVTAESSVVQNAGQVNKPGVITAQGILGRNISVGLISDSYDTAPGVPRASAGVGSGDLPGPGNPDGYTQSVVVLKDDSTSGVSDEGRGMAEIVHDIAPAAKISFSAAGNSQIAMAGSIRNLRSSPQTFCDVIVDDIGFPDEPFFSDGVISQAIDDVATSNSLPGKKVAYFSAAGNSDNRGYTADANIISAASSTPYRGNLRFSNVPAGLYAGGFQNLNATGTPGIIMNVTTGDGPGELVFQWDDPFNTGGVTTDYNLLVFNQSGTYLGTVSGTDNNFSTSQPIEIVDLAPNTTYQLVIALTSGAAPTARHMRLISFGGSGISGDYLTNDVVSIFGHPSAANANAVAAYVYSNTPNTIADYNPNKSNPPPGPYEPLVESFTSHGGNLPFYFNSQGQRLASPELRSKPEFAAADGVDTSFFPPDSGADYDNNGFPNFFGTSASAPNAGAIAALLLEAAGGPASLSPSQVRATLKQSTFPHDLDRDSSHGNVMIYDRVIDFSASGDDSNESATSPTFFTVAVSGPDGIFLRQLVIDLTPTGLIFDPRADLGFPFTVGRNDNGVSISSSLSPDQRILTLSFGDSFTPGKSISFGIDRDLAAITAGGNSADLLAGASVQAMLGQFTFLYGAFGNQLASGFVKDDGFGLIDARKAVETIVGSKPVSTGRAVNLSTRGLVMDGPNTLIGGLIISGTSAKRVILRAIGPSLPLPQPVANPAMELHGADGQLIAVNDNWQDDPSEAADIQQTGIPPNDPRESAIVKSLLPGNYTALVRTASFTAIGGIGLVEAYDLDSQPAASRLGNIATRGTVSPGDGVMIAGFILQQGTTQVIVRALGPSLEGAGVFGSLPDPDLELRDSQGTLLLENDNWQQSGSQAVQVAALGLGPTFPVESALTTSLVSGGYTAIVRGSHGTTGVALVEVYSLP
jgi:hypothetical protein